MSGPSEKIDPHVIDTLRTVVIQASPQAPEPAVMRKDQAAAAPSYSKDARLFSAVRRLLLVYIIH
jgi:hypothetical protein